MQKLQILLRSILRITSYYYKVLIYDFTDLWYQNPNFETQTISVLHGIRIYIFTYIYVCEKCQKYKYKKLILKNNLMARDS